MFETPVLIFKTFSTLQRRRVLNVSLNFCFRQLFNTMWDRLAKDNSFWGVCKTARPMLSDRCLSVRL